jgi:hypothetical protein
MKKVLAIVGVSDDIAAVRHDLPHMPSLGVSSLDSRPPWRHGGLLFCRYFARSRPRRIGPVCPHGSGLFAAILYPLSRQTDDTAAEAPLIRFLSADAVAG